MENVKKIHSKNKQKILLQEINFFFFTSLGALLIAEISIHSLIHLTNTY